MTTYVLHGGKTNEANEQNILFFRQFTELVDKPEVTILLCYWSKKKEEWEYASLKDRTKICTYTDKIVETYTVETPDDLLSRITAADVLYVAGGEAEFLEPYYRKLDSLKLSLEGKVYIGSSMGVFMASENYVLSFDSQDTQHIHSGLGFLPIQTLCHWNIEKKKKEKLGLLQKASSLPILTLNEYEFVTVYA